MKKIFIAGATGMAGSSLIQEFLKAYPTVQIRGSYHHTPPFIQHERVEYVQADLTQREECLGAIGDCDRAILVAAHTGGAGVAKTEPYRQVTDNLVMDALLLESLYFKQVQRVIYVSTATVYQAFEGFIREDQLNWNQDPHPSYLGVGWAKRSAEKLCQFWYDKYGMEVVIVRSSNIYGPYAKFNPQTANFIPALIRKAVDKTNPFEVWGSGQVTRNVIYSEDFARAITLLLTHPTLKFDIFNLGGHSTTVEEVVALALHAAGHTPQQVLYTEDKPTTIPFRALDCSKIQQTIDWKPTFSLTEGIQKTTQWWMENQHRWKK